MGSTSDILLIRRLKNGELKAFDLLFNRYWEELYIAARTRLGNEEEARDCVQELFFQLWEKRLSLEPKTNVSAYLQVALRNRIYNVFRSRTIQQKYLQFEKNKVLNDWEDGSKKLEQKELHQQIEAAIGSLPPKMQRIFRLSREEHMSIQQIADHLSLSQQTVKNELSSALKRLREKLHWPPR